MQSPPSYMSVGVLDTLLDKLFLALVTFCSSWHLLVQTQQWKHQNNVCNLFKDNNKDNRTTSMTSFEKHPRTGISKAPKNQYRDLNMWTFHSFFGMFSRIKASQDNEIKQKNTKNCFILKIMSENADAHFLCICSISCILFHVNSSQHHWVNFLILTKLLHLGEILCFPGPSSVIFKRIIQQPHPL